MISTVGLIAIGLVTLVVFLSVALAIGIKCWKNAVLAIKVSPIRRDSVCEADMNHFKQAFGIDQDLVKKYV